MQTVPYNVCVKRYYRGYVTVPDTATDEEISKIAKLQVLQFQDAAIDTDPDLEIEDDDIVYVEPDTEYAWHEDEEE